MTDEHGHGHLRDALRALCQAIEAVSQTPRRPDLWTCIEDARLAIRRDEARNAVRGRPTVLEKVAALIATGYDKDAFDLAEEIIAAVQSEAA